MRCNLNSLFLGITIEKCSLVSLLPSNKVLTEMANFLGVLTHFYVSGTINRCPNDPTKNSSFSFTIIRCVAATTRKFKNKT